jgi:hypothetical protein
MNPYINKTQAIYRLYSNVVSIHGDEAFDAEGNQVQYDINAVNTEIANQQAAEAHAQQEAATAKASALAKLTALGLTETEIKALVG